jgi:hypothetical protein
MSWVWQLPKLPLGLPVLFEHQALLRGDVSNRAVVMVTVVLAMRCTAGMGMRHCAGQFCCPVYSAYV